MKLCLSQEVQSRKDRALAVSLPSGCFFWQSYIIIHWATFVSRIVSWGTCVSNKDSMYYTVWCNFMFDIFLSSVRSLVNKTEKRTSDSMPLCIIGWMFQWRTHRTNLLFLSRHVFHLYLKLTIDMSWSSFDYPFFCRDLSIQWINQASPMSCSFGIEHHCIETYIYILYTVTWHGSCSDIITVNHAGHPGGHSGISQQSKRILPNALNSSCCNSSSKWFTPRFSLLSLLSNVLNNRWIRVYNYRCKYCKCTSRHH